MAKRNASKFEATADTESELLKNMEQAEEIFDPGDLDDVTKEATKVADGIGGSSSSGSGGAGPRGSAGGVAKPARPNVSLKGSATPEWVRAYLPHAKGAGVNLDTTRHFRWVGQYFEKADPPRCFTSNFCKYEKKCTMQHSLQQCIKWVWEAHVGNGGDPCPFDFEELAE